MTAELTEKRCAKCGKTKPIDQFARHARDGYRSRCRPCTAEDRRAYDKAHPEQRREQARRYRARHLDAVRAYQRGWIERKMAARPEKHCACGVVIPHRRRKCDQCKGLTP